MPPPLLQLASFQSGGQLLYKLHRFYAYLKGGRNEQGGEMAPKFLQRESPVLADFVAKVIWKPSSNLIPSR